MLFIMITIANITVFSFEYQNPNQNFKVENNEYDENVYGYFHDTMQDVDNYIYSNYGNNINFRLSTYHNYGLLSTINYSQTTLNRNYNNLGNLRFDINGDRVIDYNDNIGADFGKGGTCQPVAVSIAFKYMVMRGNMNYYPRLYPDKRDINNIFYEVIDAYIFNGWNGGTSLIFNCYKYINTFFQLNNIQYNATFTTFNILDRIEESYNTQIPAIGHIQTLTSGHAVAICGYVVKRIEYDIDISDGFGFSFMHISEDLTFVAVNTGWTDSGMPEYGSASMKQYNDNYSYIDLKNINAITYIKEN